MEGHPVAWYRAMPVLGGTRSPRVMHHGLIWRCAGSGRGVGEGEDVRLLGVRKLIGIGLAVLLISGALALFTSRIGLKGNDQRSYVEELDQARKQLFQGQLVYTDAARLSLVAGETHWFRAQVRGSWHPVAPGDSGAEAPAGAQIGMRLDCSGAGVTCTRVSSERNNVLSVSDQARWVWAVTAKRSGTVALALTMTAYFRDTNTVLFERSFTDRAPVATASEGSGAWFVGALMWMKDAVLELGVLAGALAAVWGLYLLVRNRHHPVEQPDEATSTATSGSAPEPPPDEQRQLTSPAARAQAGQDDATDGA